MNPMHLSGSDSWMTPDPILERARAVLGGIDLDPASSALANQRVKAVEYCDEQSDGLSRRWLTGDASEAGIYVSSVFCNPPGGVYPKGHPKRGKISKTQDFWIKLMTEVKAGHVSHAIFLFFSISGLQNCQGLGVGAPTDFVFCIPQERTRFIPPPGVLASTPSHANAIVYVPGTENRSDVFIKSFQDLGAICAGVRVPQ